MKKKMVALVLTLIMSLSVIACSSAPAPEKEPDLVPEVVVEKEPIENSTEEKTEEISVETEHPKMEISEEFVDEASEFATYALNSLFTKNETYGDAERRIAIGEIAHQDFLEMINTQVASLDEIDEVKVLSLEIGDVVILDGFRMDDSTSNEKQSAFEIKYKLIGESDGEEFISDACVIVLLVDGEFKYTAIFENE